MICKEEWCWWRGGVPYPSTNNQPNPSVTAILGQCLSLSTGTSVSQFVSHPSQHTDMLCMALAESLTGVSFVQIDDPTAVSNGGVCVVILRLLHRLGVIRVPTEYRGSGHGKCLYTYLYNIT